MAFPHSARHRPILNHKIIQFSISNRPQKMSFPSPKSALSLPPELIYELAKFMPMDALGDCCQASYQLAALGKPMALKGQKKLNHLYLEEVGDVADWFRNWSMEMAQIRAPVCHQAFKKLKAQVQSWHNCSEEEKAREGVRERHGRVIIRLMNDLAEFYNGLTRLSYKINEIFDKDPIDLLSRFRLSQVTCLKLGQLRDGQIDSAFAPADAELTMWLVEQVPRWYETFFAFGNLLRVDFTFELNYCLQEFAVLTQHVVTCKNMLKSSANHLRLI